MTAQVRRPAAAAAAAPPAPVGINFLDLGMYSGGGGLPEGDYVIADTSVQMYQATNAQGVTRGPARLGVMFTFQSMLEPAAEFKTQFYSMGGKAHESYAPNPVTGKGVVAVAGGTASNLNDKTNWFIFLQSLFNCDPELAGIMSNDTSVLEGAHVHLAPTPAPAERASFKSQTAEYQQEEKARDIMIVTEIKDDGKPWQGTGGLLDTGAPAPAAAPTAAAHPAARVAAAPVAAPAAVAGQTDSPDEAILNAALDGITSVLGVEGNQMGITKLKLRMETSKAVSAAGGPQLSAAVLAKYFASDVALNSVLNTLGYKVVGVEVKPA